MSEEKHTLATEIELLFGNAVSETERLANAMNLLNTAVTGSEGKLNLSQLLSDVNKLKEALSGGGNLVAELDAGNIKKRAESFLNNAINNMQIELKHETRGRKVNQIDVSHETGKLADQAHKQMMAEVKKAIEEGIVPGSFNIGRAKNKTNVDTLKLNNIDEMIKLTAQAGYEGAVDTLNRIKDRITQPQSEQEGFKFVIPPSAVTAVKNTIQDKIITALENAQVHGNFKPVASFNLQSLDLIQKRMRTALEEAINKNLEFEFINDKTKEKVPLKFTFTTELMHRVTEMAQRELANVLVQPGSVKLPEGFTGADLKINVSGLEETLNKIKTWLASVNRHLLTADTEVNTLVSSGTGMESFQQQVTAVGEKIKRITGMLGQVQVSDDTAGLTAFVKEVDALQGSLVHFLNVYKKIPATMRSSFDEQLSVVLKEYESAVAQLKNQVSFRGLSEGVATLQQKMQDSLEQTFAQLMKEAPPTIDAGKLLAVYKAWSGSLTEHLGQLSAEELKRVTAALVSESEGVQGQVARSLQKLLHVAMPKQAEGEGIALPYHDVQERVKASVQAFVRQLVNEFEITRPPKEGEGLGVSIEMPKQAIERVQTMLKNMVEEQLREIAAQTGKQKLSLSGEEAKQMDALLYAESKQFLNLVVDQARSIAKSFTDGVSKDGFATFTQEERTKVRDELLKGIGHIVSELSTTIQVLLKSFSVPTDLQVATGGKTAGMLQRIMESIDRKIIRHMDQIQTAVESEAGAKTTSRLHRLKTELSALEHSSIPKAEMEHLKKENDAYRFFTALRQAGVARPVQGDDHYGKFYVSKDPLTSEKVQPEIPKWVRSLFAPSDTGVSFSHAARYLSENYPDLGIHSEDALMERLKTLANRYKGFRAIEEDIRRQMMTEADRVVADHIRADIARLERMERLLRATRNYTPKGRRYRISEEQKIRLEDIYADKYGGRRMLFFQEEVQVIVAQKREENAPVRELKQKLTTTQTALAKEIEDKIINNTDSSMRDLALAIREIQLPPMEFTIVGRIQSWMQQIQDETMRVLERMVDSSLRPVLEHSTGQPYPPGFNPFGGTNIPPIPHTPQSDLLPRTEFDRMHALERQALINAERIQNRFNDLMQKGNFTQENFASLTNFLNAYQAEVRAAVGQYRGVLQQYGTDGIKKTGDETVDDAVAEAKARMQEAAKLAEQRLQHQMERIYKPANQSDSLTKQLMNQEFKLGDYAGNAVLNVQKMQTRFYGKLDEPQMQALNGELTRYMQLAEQLASMRLMHPEDIERSKQEMQYLNQLLASISARYGQISKESSETAKQNRTIDKRGELIGQSDLFKGMVLNASQLKNALKQMDQFSNIIDITNAQVRKGTDGWNSWSASMKTAEGNTVRMSGVVNTLTGEIYRQSESIREAQSRLERYAQMNAVVSPFANSMRGGHKGQKDYSVSSYNPVTGQMNMMDPGGDTNSFTGSVVNTMRYMLSGMLMGAPTMMFHSAFEAARTFDYQLEKARQNFTIKDPKMWNQAIENVSIKHGDVKDKDELNKLVKEESDKLVYEIRDGAVERLQNIAITYAVPTAELSKAWQIGSRIMNDPFEGIAFTREVAKVRTLEQVDVEKAALGFEAIKAQWGANVNQLEKYNNMMIKASNISTVTVEDLLEANKRAGSIMRNNLEGSGMSKDESFAGSVAFFSLFSQGSARSGAEGGTFAKAVTERPYQSAQAEYFKKKAEQLGIEKLNPYKIDEFGNKQKRAFTEWLPALAKAMTVAMPTDQTEILKQAAGVYHSGSSAAIQAMIADMQKNREEIAKRVNYNRVSQGLEAYDPKADMDKIMEEYIKKISEATPEESEVMLAGMATTWNFQIDRVKAMWESSTFRVLDALKPEFQDLTTTLGVLLRSMRENATAWAQAITGITNIGMMLATGYGMNMLLDKWKGSGQQTRMDEVDRQRGLLQAERHAISFRKDLLEDRLGKFNGQYGKEIDRFNAVKDDRVYKARTDLMQAEFDVEQARGNYERRRGSLTPAEDQQERARIHSLERAAMDKRKIAEDEERKHGLDSKVLDEYSRLQKEMTQVAVQTHRLNQRMNLLDRGTEQLGIDTSQLQVKMDRLDKEFRNGSINADMYNKLMKETARAAGVTEDNIERLQKEMDKLQRKFNEGRISAQAFNKQVDSLRNMHLAGDAALPGGGYGGRANQGGADMMNMVAQASMFGALMGGFSDRSIFSRTGDVFALMKEAVRDGSVIGFARSFGGFVGGGLERDADGKIVRDENGRVRRRQITTDPVGDEDGKGRGALSKLAASSPRLAGALGGGLSMLLRLLAGGVGLGLLSGGFAAFTYGMANDNEKTQIDIQQFKDIEKNVMAMKESSSWFIRSVVGVKEIIDTLTDGVKSILTDGSLDGFRKHGNAWVMGWNAQTPKEFEQQMEAQAGVRIREQMVERYGEAEVKRREQIFSEMYFKEASTLEDYKKISQSFSFDDDRKKEEEQKKTDEFVKKAAGVTSYETMESIQAFLEPIERKLEAERSRGETGYEVAKTKALLSGMREDSEQVRKLTNDFLKSQIGLLQAYISQLEAKKKEMLTQAQKAEKEGKAGEVERVKNSEEYLAVDLKVNGAAAQVAQMQLQMGQTDLSAISSITTKLERAKRMAQAEGGIRRANLLLGGAKEDSMAVKLADRQTTMNINNQIAQTIAELQKQLNSGKFQGEDRNDILLQIKELQAESRDNLVKIKEKLTNSLSTYNLPQGIQGMTYQEAMQRKNDYRSYAVTNGGLTIQVNVPVQGQFGDEKMAQQRGQATARQVAQEVANVLSGQVRSFGLGQNYFSPFSIGRV